MSRDHSRQAQGTNKLASMRSGRPYTMLGRNMHGQPDALQCCGPVCKTPEHAIPPRIFHVYNPTRSSLPSARLAQTPSRSLLGSSVDCPWTRCEKVSARLHTLAQRANPSHIGIWCTLRCVRQRVTLSRARIIDFASSPPSAVLAVSA
jgi:hypothetical protein